MRSVWRECKRLITKFVPKWRAFSRDFVTTLERWWMQILEQLVPIIPAYRAERTVQRRITAEENTEDLGANQSYMTVDLEALRDSHKIELARREQIRTRAQGNLMTATLAVSLVLGATALRAQAVGDDTTETTAWFVRVMLAAGVGFLFMSALSAVRVIRIEKLHDMWLEMRTKPFGMSSPEEDEKAKLIKMTVLNQLYTTILSNYAYASYVSMRNGLFAIGVFLVLVILWDGHLW